MSLTARKLPVVGHRRARLHRRLRSTKLARLAATPSRPIGISDGGRLRPNAPIRLAPNEQTAEDISDAVVPPAKAGDGAAPLLPPAGKDAAQAVGVALGARPKGLATRHETVSRPPAVLVDITAVLTSAVKAVVLAGRPKLQQT